MINLRENAKGLALVVAALGAVLSWPGHGEAAGASPALAYRLHCVGCHMEDGSGSKAGLIPPIPGIAGHFLKHEKGRLYLVNVPGVVNAGLPDNDTASLLNYVLSTWGASDLPQEWAPFTGDEVHSLRQVKVHDITVLRKEIAADLAKLGIDLQY